MAGFAAVLIVSVVTVAAVLGTRSGKRLFLMTNNRLTALFCPCSKNTQCIVYILI